MVNKPHAPRSGNKSSKKPAATTINGEDTSYIVFGDDKKSSKKNASTSTPNTSSSSAKQPTPSNTTSTDPPTEKKPDTRTLIAGPSWTGKLPQTLLSELCQKSRWEKPEYTMRQSTSGYTSTVILRHKHPKTGAITILPPIAPPADYVKERGARDTAVEARHLAATYALWRLGGSAKNMGMALPVQYRELWRGDFVDLKSADVAAGNGWMYEADPFAAVVRREEERLVRERERVKAGKRVEEERKLEVVGLDGRVQSKHVLKGWLRVPKVEMGVRRRREVEGLVRRGGVWNGRGVRMGSGEVGRVVEELAGIGFRKSHVEEAAEICKDKDECLEWLLIHVPEDDLPKWTLPDNYMAGVSLASADLKKEGKIKRLAAAGYGSELCAEVLDECAGDEDGAAIVLQARLLEEELADVPSIPSLEAWEEEQATLEAIYGEKYTSNGSMCTITLELQTPSKKAIVLRARPPRSEYPDSVPIICVEADLPAHVRLSITKRVIAAAREEFLGQQMLFSIVDWLEQHIPSVIENPGRLSEVAGGATLAPVRNIKKQKTLINRHKTRIITGRENSQVSQNILAAWEARHKTSAQQTMMQARQRLPAWKLEEDIVSSVNKNQVTIISGETGSGKSTQSVQFILDDLIHRSLGEETNIICTQPRRISALGLADRVADERCGQVGDEVGYAIRGESKQRSGVTKITFVTTGVLLRRLQTSGGSTEDVIRSLADVSHVVIDEVHERSLDTDFLLVLLRDVLAKRKDLKLILMSATLDAETFESYFTSSCTVGKVEIEGRTHPVHDIYLDEILRLTGFGANVDLDQEDQPNNPCQLGNALRAVGTRINYDLIARTVEHIHRKLGDSDGGILIFLPGVAEIDQTLRALRDIPGLHALPLHASLISSEQKRVFPRPPGRLRKVIAATNVAETSITIEDIVAVIDTGRVKETSFDPGSNMIKLAEVWASRAACKQRRGRAGRVRAGECYKLYTKSAESKMAERPDPEIRRVPLEQLCLSVKAMGVHDVRGFLASALTPPETLAVHSAIELLGRMGALDKEELTSLGRHLSMIPADLRCAKLLVYGATFGCLESCLAIAAILTIKSPFVSPQAKRDEAKAARSSFAQDCQGDLICDLHAYQQWSERRANGVSSSSLRFWCDENFLNQQTLFDIATSRSQYVSSLQEIGFLPLSYHPTNASGRLFNQHNDDLALLRALIAGSFNPQVARIEYPDKKYAASSSGAVEVDPEARTIKYMNQDNGRIFVHPGSTLFDAQAYPGNAAYMSYFTKMATSKVFVRDLTPFGVYGLLMFSGPIAIDPQGRGLLVDGWIRLRGWARIGVLVSRMRMMLDDVLARKLDDPGADLEGNEVVQLVRKMVELDGLDR